MAQFCSKCGKPIEPNANFCTSCGNSLRETKPPRASLQSKRQKVLGDRHAAPQRKLLKYFGVGLVLLFGGYVFLSSLPSGTHPVIEAQPVVSDGVTYPVSASQMFDIPAKVESGNIIIPLDLIQQRKFVAFNYISPTITVPLLAYVSGGGKLVTAVSMCEPCNSRRFHIKGENLVCNTCGSTWELDNLQAVSGACRKFPPDPITSVVVGNEVRIDEAVVANWKPRI